MRPMSDGANPKKYDNAAASTITYESMHGVKMNEQNGGGRGGCVWGGVENAHKRSHLKEERLQNVRHRTRRLKIPDMYVQAQTVLKYASRRQR